jgi:hypothetical protein
MSLRAELGFGVNSIEAVRSLVGVGRPASLQDILIRYRQPIVIDESLVTPDGVPLGGHHTITLERGGSVRHQGHMRATGFPSFTFGVRTVLVNDAGIPAVATASGRVHGTNEPGDREFSWDQSGPNPLVALHWAAMKRSRPETSINREADFFGTIGDVLGFASTLIGGAIVAGPAGVCIVLGVHIADLAGIDEQLGTAGLAGVAVAGGVLVVFGPGAIIPAVAAGAAAGIAVETAIQHRPMTAEQRAFAERVFGPTLPVDRIVLTNLVGIGKRPFTIPSIGEAILVNLGAGFDDPTHYRGYGHPDLDKQNKPRAEGQLFIHELVHAWQIDTETFLPGLICEAVGAQLTTLGGNMAVYRYGAAGPAFSEFNPEQQASIVDDWFAGSGKQEGHRPQVENDRNPYFRYIRDNIRNRIP